MALSDQPVTYRYPVNAPACKSDSKLPGSKKATDLMPRIDVSSVVHQLGREKG